MKISLLLWLILGANASQNANFEDLTNHTRIREQTARLEQIAQLRKSLREDFEKVRSRISDLRPEDEASVEGVLTSFTSQEFKNPESPTEFAASLGILRKINAEGKALVTDWANTLVGSESEPDEEAFEFDRDRTRAWGQLKEEMDRLSEESLADGQSLWTAVEAAVEKARLANASQSPSPTQSPASLDEDHKPDVLKETSLDPSQPAASVQDIERAYTEGAEAAETFFQDGLKGLEPLVQAEAKINQLTEENSGPEDPISPTVTGDPTAPPSGPLSPPEGPAGPGPGELGDPGESIAGDPDAGQPEQQEEPQPGTEAQPEEQSLAEQDPASEESASGSGGGGGGGSGGGNGGQGGGGSGSSAPNVPFASGFSSFQGPGAIPNVDTSSVAQVSRVVTSDSGLSKFKDESIAVGAGLPPVVPNAPGNPREKPARIRDVLQGRSPASFPAQASGGLGSISPPLASKGPGESLAPNQAAVAGGGAPSGVGSNFQGNPFNGRPSYPKGGGSKIKTRRAAYGGGGGTVNNEVEPKQIRVLKKLNKAQILDQSAFAKNKGLGLMEHVGNFNRWCRKSAARSVKLCNKRSSSPQANAGPPRSPAP